MCRRQNGGFSLVKISPVERGIQHCCFFFLTRIPVNNDEALNFSLTCLIRNIGYKMFFHNKVVVPSGYSEKRSFSVFPFKCVYIGFGFPWGTVVSFSIIITKVRNDGYPVIWQLLNSSNRLVLCLFWVFFLLKSIQLISREQGNQFIKQVNKR